MFPILLQVLLPAALAAELDVFGQRHPGPYRVEYRGNGDVMVVDDDGEVVPTHEVLRVVEGDEVASRYENRRRGRKAGAVLLWVGSGVVATGGGVAALAGEPVGGLAVLGGAGMFGGGFLTLYGPAANRLDHWTTEDEVVAALEAVDEGAVPVARRADWELVDGVPSRDGYPLSPLAIALALDDDTTAHEYRWWRRSRGRTGGALVAGGAAVGLASLVVGLDAEDSDVRQAGLGTAAVGGAALVGGVVSLVVTGPRNRAEAWFSPEELEEAVRRHNEGGAPAGPDARLLPEAPRLTVHPTVGLGYLGLQGTF